MEFAVNFLVIIQLISLPALVVPYPLSIKTPPCVVILKEYHKLATQSSGLSRRHEQISRTNKLGDGSGRERAV